MHCRDNEGGWHASDTVNFTTGKSQTREKIKLIFKLSGVPIIAEPKLADIYSPLSKEGVETDRLNRGMLSIRPAKGVSPHFLMGKKVYNLSLN